MAFESLKEGFKKVQEGLGFGPRAGFKKEVESLVAGGATRQSAQKEKFLEYISKVAGEAGTQGIISYRSKDWINFEAALRVLFSNQERRNFENLSDPNEASSLYTRINVLPTQQGYNSARQYFEREFNGEVPKPNILRDVVKDTEYMRQLIVIIDGWLRPLIGTNVDINTILAANPGMQADVGMIERLKKTLDQAESRFGREVVFHRTWEQYKENSIKEVAEIFWGAPSRLLLTWLKETGKTIIHPTPPRMAGAILNLTKGTISAATSELANASKLLYGTAKVVFRYFNKK